MEDEDLVEALEEAPDDNELDRLDPVPETLTLSKSGLEVRVLELRTRQLFKLLRIITHGAGSQFVAAGLDFSDEQSVFVQKLITLVLFSIPDAGDETIEFLQSMVEPVGLHEGALRDLNDKQRQHNIELWTELNMETANPEPEDTVDLVEMIVRREAADIQALGKRLRRFLELANKTGQLKDESGKRKTETVDLPGSSPVRSTSSRTSTAGRTSRSSASRSAASGRSSRPSQRGEKKRSGTDAQLSSGRPRSWRRSQRPAPRSSR